MFETNFSGRALEDELSWTNGRHFDVSRVHHTDTGQEWMMDVQSGMIDSGKKQ